MFANGLKQKMYTLRAYFNLFLFLTWLGKIYQWTLLKAYLLQIKKNAVLVVVDCLTKYGHFLALKHPFTAKDVAELFLREVYRLHGLPRTIIFDRDTIFTSHFLQHLFRSMGTKLTLSSAYHPHTDR